MQPAAIYHHFASKEDILVGLQDDFMLRLADRVVAAVERHERWRCGSPRRCASTWSSTGSTPGPRS